MFLDIIIWIFVFAGVGGVLYRGLFDSKQPEAHPEVVQAALQTANAQRESQAAIAVAEANKASPLQTFCNTCQQPLIAQTAPLAVAAQLMQQQPTVTVINNPAPANNDPTPEPPKAA